MRALICMAIYVHLVGMYLADAPTAGSILSQPGVVILESSAPRLNLRAGFGNLLGMYRGSFVGGCPKGVALNLYSCQSPCKLLF